MYKHRRLIVSIIAIGLVLLLVGGLLINAFAESSAEIKEKIEGLKEQEAAIQAQQKELENQISEKEGDINDLVLRKNKIDQEIKLTRDSIDNKNEQIRAYNLLIAEKQRELDAALKEQETMSAKYKTRLRSMEENGKLTYWSILFQASSFADMLDRVDMINEIALADSRMLDSLEEAARQVEEARAALAEEKISLEAAKDELAEAENALAAQREEEDAIFAELTADRAALKESYAKKEDEEAYLIQRIAEEEANYQEAVAAEEAARRAAEEAARRAAEEQAAREAAARQQAATSSSSSSSYSFSTSGYGFQWPTTSRYISCPFGPRIHPVTGAYNNHSGIDIGASYGSPIYACASGTVTKAEYSYYFGWHVVINHGNGFSTLYGHMCQYIVSPGQYVTKGQIIGYVGTSGLSTGPHIHLTMYYNGSLVNPIYYLP